MVKDKNWSLGILRIILGLLFILLGITKLINSEGFIGFVSSLVPGGEFFGWLILLSEIVFGFAILIGWKTKYTIWPPFVIVLAAILLVWLPKEFITPVISAFFQHLLILAGLLVIWKHGNGAWSLNKK